MSEARGCFSLDDRSNDGWMVVVLRSLTYLASYISTSPAGEMFVGKDLKDQVTYLLTDSLC